MATSKIFTGNNITDFEDEINDWLDDAAQLDIQIFNIFFIAREQVSTPGVDLSLTILYDLGGTTMANPFVVSLFSGEDGSALETAQNVTIDAAAQFVQGPYVDYQKETRNINKYHSLVITNGDKTEADAAWFVNVAQP